MKTIAITMVLALLTLGCADSKVLDGIEYDSVGVFNTRNKSTDVCYEVVLGNAVWSALLVQTIAVPVYFIGWSILEPMDLKANVENPEGCW